MHTRMSCADCHTISLSLANFVGFVVGVLDVLVIRLRRLLLAAALSFESEMVSYVDLDTNKRFVFLTNIFTVPAKTVADIYKQRWQVELFFNS